MLDWLLRQTSGLLDWLLVIACVFGMVFLIQFVVNYLDGPGGNNKKGE